MVVWGLGLGFWGWGFQLGMGPVVQGLLGFLGSLYKRITLGNKWCLKQRLPINPNSNNTFKNSFYIYFGVVHPCLRKILILDQCKEYISLISVTTALSAQFQVW